MTAEPGRINGTLANGTVVEADKYAQAIFPAGKGVRGLSYKIRCQVFTADPNISPVCAAIVPVI